MPERLEADVEDGCCIEASLNLRYREYLDIEFLTILADIVQRGQQLLDLRPVNVCHNVPVENCEGARWYRCE